MSFNTTARHFSKDISNEEGHLTHVQMDTLTEACALVIVQSEAQPAETLKGAECVHTRVTAV